MYQSSLLFRDMKIPELTSSFPRHRFDELDDYEYPSFSSSGRINSSGNSNTHVLSAGLGPGGAQLGVFTQRYSLADGVNGLGSAGTGGANGAVNAPGSAGAGSSQGNSNSMTQVAAAAAHRRDVRNGRMNITSNRLNNDRYNTHAMPDDQIRAQNAVNRHRRRPSRATGNRGHQQGDAMNGGSNPHYTMIHAQSNYAYQPPLSLYSAARPGVMRMPPGITDSSLNTTYLSIEIRNRLAYLKNIPYTGYSTLRPIGLCKSMKEMDEERREYEAQLEMEILATNEVQSPGVAEVNNESGSDENSFTRSTNVNNSTSHGNNNNSNNNIIILGNNSVDSIPEDDRTRRQGSTTFTTPPHATNTNNDNVTTPREGEHGSNDIMRSPEAADLAQIAHILTSPRLFNGYPEHYQRQMLAIARETGIPVRLNYDLDLDVEDYDHGLSYQIEDEEEEEEEQQQPHREQAGNSNSNFSGVPQAGGSIRFLGTGILSSDNLPDSHGNATTNGATTGGTETTTASSLMSISPAGLVTPHTLPSSIGGFQTTEQRTRERNNENSQF